MVDNGNADENCLRELKDGECCGLGGRVVDTVRMGDEMIYENTQKYQATNPIFSFPISPIFLPYLRPSTFEPPKHLPSPFFPSS